MDDVHIQLQAGIAMIAGQIAASVCVSMLLKSVKDDLQLPAKDDIERLPIAPLIEYAGGVYSLKGDTMSEWCCQFVEGCC